MREDAAGRIGSTPKSVPTLRPADGRTRKTDEQHETTLPGARAASDARVLPRGIGRAGDRPSNRRVHGLNAGMPAICCGTPEQRVHSRPADWGNYCHGMARAVRCSSQATMSSSGRRCSRGNRRPGARGLRQGESIPLWFRWVAEINPSPFPVPFSFEVPPDERGGNR